MHKLQVGDSTPDKRLIVHAEDKLCYQVWWCVHGRRSLRTISKALLAEWVKAYTETPGATSKEVRLRLVGMSDVDRFEYGYEVTLAVMAKMIIGHIPLIRIKP